MKLTAGKCMCCGKPYNLSEQGKTIDTDTMIALADKWDKVKYTGDYTKAVYEICAKELRAVLSGAK